MVSMRLKKVKQKQSYANNQNILYLLFSCNFELP